jgi:hypothetical protein
MKIQTAILAESKPSRSGKSNFANKNSNLRLLLASDMYIVKRIVFLRFRKLLVAIKDIAINSCAIYGSLITQCPSCLVESKTDYPG